MTTNTKWLLAAVVVLAFIRFAVVPAFQSQQQLLDQRKQYQSQIARSQQVLAKKDEYEFLLLKAQSNVQRLENEFPDYQDRSEFRFQFQRSMEQLAKTNNVRITRADWREQESGEVVENVNMGEFLMFVRGHGLDVMQFHRQLTKLGSSIKVKAIRLDIDEFGNEPMELIEGPITLAVYYRTEGEQ